MVIAGGDILLLIRIQDRLILPNILMHTQFVTSTISDCLPTFVTSYDGAKCALIDVLYNKLLGFNLSYL
jgi:hypothetical protein